MSARGRLSVRGPRLPRFTGLCGIFGLARISGLLAEVGSIGGVGGLARLGRLGLPAFLDGFGREAGFCRTGIGEVGVYRPGWFPFPRLGGVGIGRGLGQHPGAVGIRRSARLLAAHVHRPVFARLTLTGGSCVGGLVGRLSISASAFFHRCAPTPSRFLPGLLLGGRPTPRLLFGKRPAAGVLRVGGSPATGATDTRTGVNGA